MKRIIAVRHADGTEEKECPKCNQLMTLREGGAKDTFDRGSHGQEETHDIWNCEDCKVIFDPQVERELEMAFAGVQ